MNSAGPRCPCALIVDDEPDTRYTLRELLLLAGVAEVKTAGSLSDAEQALRHGSRPSALVLDLKLASERGENLLERLRAEPAYATLPVIVVSGDKAALGRVASQVARTFLKPADPDRLVEEVMSSVKGAG